MANAFKYDLIPFEDYLAGERDVTIRLESVGLDVPVEHIYRRVRKEVGLEVAR